VVSALLVGSFLYAGVSIHHLHITGPGLWRTGTILVRHNVGKVLLAGHFLLVMFTAGELFFRAVRRRHRHGGRPMARLICAGFAGATVLALAMFLLGLANAYSRATALAVMLPLLAAAPFVLHALLGDLAGQACRFIAAGSRMQRLAVALGVAGVLGAAGALLINKVMLPESRDGDVWEHYLHYFHQVVQTGGIWPNDVWYHFYLSKGAGLFFLAILCSDILAAPVISFCFAVLSALVVFDLLHRRAQGPLWGLLGVVLFFLFLALPTPEVASFTKHHIAVMAYMALALWCVLGRKEEAGESHAAGRAPVGLTGALGLFYLGLYVPAAAAILLSSLVSVAVGTWLLDRRSLNGRLVAWLAAACVAGVAAALALNYAVTGLPETVPMRRTWAAVDLERFERWWCRCQVEYYFLEAEPLARREVGPLSFLQIDPEWTALLCRLRYFSSVADKLLGRLLLLLLVVAALRETSLLTMARECWGATRRRLLFFAQVAAYLAGALVIAQAFPGGSSLERMYCFTGLFIVLGIVAAASVLTGPVVARYSWAGALVLPLAMWPGIKPVLVTTTTPAVRFALGKTSAGGALGKLFPYGTSLTNFVVSQGLIPAGQRQLHLTYEPQPGYFLAGEPVVTEPSYAFAGHYDELLYGSAERARSILEGLGITHVSFDLESRLFLGLPYAPLFRAENLGRHFEFVWRSGSFYLLRLRRPGSRCAPLPPDMLQGLELKQKPNVHNLFQDRFEKWLVGRMVNREGGPAVPCSCGSANLEMSAASTRRRVRAVWDAMENRVLAGLAVPDNRRTLRRLIAAERAHHLAAVSPLADGLPPPVPENLREVCHDGLTRLRIAVSNWLDGQWGRGHREWFSPVPEVLGGRPLYERMRARYERQHPPGTGPHEVAGPARCSPGL
jgi:hypothetical protein